jgi:hypothetical protein
MRPLASISFSLSSISACKGSLESYRKPLQLLLFRQVVIPTHWLERASGRSEMGKRQAQALSGQGIQEGGGREVVPKQWTGRSDHKQLPLHQQVHCFVRSVSWGGVVARK